MIERGFYPGWEFREILREERNAVLFDLAGDPLLVLDEPSALESEVRKISQRLAEAFEEVEDPLAEPPDRYIFNEEEWQLALQLFPRLALEQLGLAPGRLVSLRNLQTQPTTRYHGNVAAFMAEVKGRLASGEHVMVSAASTGELERFADICHEYELPYRLGELEENVTVTRLAEEGSSGNTPAMVLVKAPLAEGVLFPKRSSSSSATATCSKRLRLPRSARARGPRRPASSAISRISSPAITSSTWTTASANSKACARWVPTAPPANSCCCAMRTTRASTFRWRAST